MVALDALGRVGEGGPHLGGDHVHRLVELARGDGEFPCALRGEAVETLRELQESGIAAVPAVGDDGVHRGVDGGIHVHCPALHRRHHRVGPEGPRVERADHGRARMTARASVFARISSMSDCTASYSVFMDARFTMSRAVERVISATSARPLARSVSPDCTRSTIRSASPTSGASSIEPSRRTISTWMPRSEKYASVVRGYLVATRTQDHFAGSSRCQSSRGSATTRRQNPKPRSSGSYTSGACSARMSLPTMPRSAAPYVT